MEVAETVPDDEGVAVKNAESAGQTRADICRECGLATDR